MECSAFKNILYIFFTLLNISPKLEFSSSMPVDISEFEKELLFSFDRAVAFSSFQEFVYKNTTVETVSTDVKSDFESLRRSLTDRLLQLLEIGLEYKSILLSQKFTTRSSITECSSLDFSNIIQEGALIVKTDPTKFCYILSRILPKNTIYFPPPSVLQGHKKIYDNAQSQGLLTSFFTNAGLGILYPAVDLGSRNSGYVKFDPRNAPYYGSTINLYSRDVVVISKPPDDDGGSSERNTSNEVSSTVIMNIVSSLLPKDRILFIPEHANADATESCVFKELSPVTHYVKAYMFHNIHAWITNSQIQAYSPLLQSAFKIFRNRVGVKRHVGIIIVCSSVFNDLRDVLRVIESEADFWKNAIDSSPYLFLFQIGTGKEVFDELQAILRSYINGKSFFYQIKDEVSMESAPQFNREFRPQNKGSVRMTPPFADDVTQSSAITLSVPIFSNNSDIAFGVFAMTIQVGNLFSDLISYGDKVRGYSFVFDRSDGTTLIHPLLLPPFEEAGNRPIVNISFLEKGLLQGNGTNDLISILFRGGETGMVEVQNVEIKPFGDSYNGGVSIAEKNSTYYHAGITIGEINLKMCLVVPKNKPISMSKPILHLHKDTKFTYHKYFFIDDFDADVCRNFFHVCAGIISTVKLAPSSFLSPSVYLYGSTTDRASLERVPNYREIFSGEKVNDIFVDGVLHDVQLTSVLEDWWLHGNSSHSSAVTYPLWRSITTKHGTFRLFPGGTYRVERIFNPTDRNSYIQAESEKNTLVMTVPHKGSVGEGYFVEMAKAVLENKKDPSVFGVLTVAVTLHYLHHLMETTVSNCSNYSCFLIDKSGFVLSHPLWDLPEWEDIPRIGYRHVLLIEKEIGHRLMAGGYMTERVCFDMHRFQERVTYEVDFDEIVDEEGFSAIKIPSTNVFLIVKGNVTLLQKATEDCAVCLINNLTCVTNTLLSCNCSCRDLFKFGLCSEKIEPPDYVPCLPRTISVDPFVIRKPDKRDLALSGLKHCFFQNCGDVNDSVGDCHSLSGCRWCSHNLTGEPLEEPFCGRFDDCYLGQLGRNASYLYPELVELFESRPGQISNQKEEAKTTLIIISVTVTAFVLIVLICVLVFWKRKRHSGSYFLSKKGRLPSITLLHDDGQNEVIFEATRIHHHTSGRTLRDDMTLREAGFSLSAPHSRLSVTDLVKATRQEGRYPWSNSGTSAQPTSKLTKKGSAASINSMDFEKYLLEQKMRGDDRKVSDSQTSTVSSANGVGPGTENAKKSDQAKSGANSDTNTGTGTSDSSSTTTASLSSGRTLDSSQTAQSGSPL